MAIIVFKIPISVTDNRRHQIAYRRRMMVDTEEFRSWKAFAFQSILNQLPHGWKPLDPTEDKQLPYIIQIFAPSRRVDATNFLKGLQDVLTNAGVWTDDRWVRPQFLPSELDKEHPMAVIVIPMDEATREALWPPNGYTPPIPPETKIKIKRRS